MDKNKIKNKLNGILGEWLNNNGKTFRDYSFFIPMCYFNPV